MGTELDMGRRACAASRVFCRGGVGEYSCQNLSTEQEWLFCAEVDAWISAGWLVEHDTAAHGKPRCILPLLARVQEHKVTTPMRLCLNYRRLNECLVSQPGSEAPVCQETLGKWRKGGHAEEFDILDDKKAYMQVSPLSLLRFQVVRWNNKTYVMTRMGFGLSVAPKFMDMIIRWVTKDMADHRVDNYVHDVRVPRTETQNAASAFAACGLPTKEPETMVTTSVGAKAESIAVWRYWLEPPRLVRFGPVRSFYAPSSLPLVRSSHWSLSWPYVLACRVQLFEKARNFLVSSTKVHSQTDLLRRVKAV